MINIGIGVSWAVSKVIKAVVDVNNIITENNIQIITETGVNIITEQI